MGITRTVYRALLEGNCQPASKRAIPFIACMTDFIGQQSRQDPPLQRCGVVSFSLDHIDESLIDLSGNITFALARSGALSGPAILGLAEEVSSQHRY